MKRFLPAAGFLFLILMVPVAAAAGALPETTPEKTGGSIYFETDPPGTTIWLDNVRIGTSPFTYYSEQSGTFTVHVSKKGYDDYRGNVTVGGGVRTDFYARLTPVVYDLNAGTPAPVVITTLATQRRATMSVPTSWPTTPPEKSPVDAALVIAAASVAAGVWSIRRR